MTPRPLRSLTTTTLLFVFNPEFKGVRSNSTAATSRIWLVALFCFALLVICAPRPAVAQNQVEISEFLAANSGTLTNKFVRDEDGDSSDWIELHNRGTNVVNLDGWFLTDTTNNLTEWRIPAVVLQPGDYYIIWASGKDRTNLAAGVYPHANFQLSKSGEYLGLLDPGTNVLSDFFPAFPAQQTDVSFGRDNFSPEITGYFLTPTPLAPNSTQGAGFGPAVVFSTNSVNFISPFSLGLSLSDPTRTNAVIRYLLITNQNAFLPTNVPTASSPIYTDPIPITGSTIVRARAFETNLFPGPVHSENYIMLSTNVLGFSSELPLLVLHSFTNVGGNFPNEPSQFAAFEVFDLKNGRSSLTNVPDLTSRAGIHDHGSSTGGQAKHNMALELWDEANGNRNLDLLGLPSENDFILYGIDNFDPVQIHNPVALQLSRDIGRYAARTRLVEVYWRQTTGTLTSNDYFGTYVLEEKIKINQNRVDIDKLAPENVTPPSVTGGYLMSIDRGVQEGGAAFPTPSLPNVPGNSVNYLDPNGTEITQAQRLPQANYIRNYFGAFVTNLNSASYTNPVTGYSQFIDVDSWIDHHLLNTLTFNIDMLRLSGYFYKPRNGKIFMGPIWDFDRTQGSTDGRDFNPRIWRSAVPDLGTDVFNYPWWNRLFQDPDFWQKWIDRFQALRGDQFSTNHIFTLIDSLANQIREAEARDIARWPGFTTPRNSNVTASDGSGYSFNFTGKGYQGEVDFMKQWYRDRLNFMDTNFISPPAFNFNGGPIVPGFDLVISAPPGTLYYTLDGSDPRAPGGAVSPAAQIYRGPVSLFGNARVVARVLNPSHRNLTGPNNPPISSPWSGPMAATFVVTAPALIITEIMYNPQKAPAGNTNDADNFEFVELKNVGPTTLDLSGIQFTNGIYFNFTGSSVTNLGPGEYVLVVKNKAAFSSRYPSVANVAGEYSGGLDNGGERITLVGRFLELILDFSYHDGWYPITDGQGFSLVLANENASFDSLGDSAAWRVSSEINGSPSQADPSPPAIAPIVINEVRSHESLPATDAVELFNPTGNPVDLSGWFLTDDFNTPNKFLIPNGTIITGLGFAVFTEADFNSGAAGSFALGAHGDSIYLFSADAGGNLTGYSHGFAFGPQANNVSFGRYVTSEGEEHFVSQIINTFGAPNAGPLISPVVINELMYHPPDLLSGGNAMDDQVDEFIELYNRTAGPVPLFDPNYPTNTWRLRNGVDYVFPPNVTIPPNSYVLVVSFDPANSTLLTAFLNYYALPNTVAVFGPSGGKLDNEVDNIELARPDSPDSPTSSSPGFVPYILVDKVKYQDGPPWPIAADGTGASLQRINSAAYGDDPINWAAAAPTPAAAYAQVPPFHITSQPVSQTAVAGTNVTFTVATDGPGGYRYQWRFGGMNLPGATNSALVLSNIQAAQAGDYLVVISDAQNAVVSSVATLAVLLPVTIVFPPPNQSVFPGNTISFSVEAAGSQPIKYQWFYNNGPIAGATRSTLILSNLQPSQAGNYSVVVSNNLNSVPSSSATLVINTNPVIILQPKSVAGFPGTNLTFTVSAISGTPIRYQWYFGGNALTGATNASLSVTNIQEANGGNYQVVVTDDYGTVSSDIVSLLVLLKPVISQQPQGQTVGVGGTANFSISASGTLPMTYRWRRAGVTLSNGVFIINSNTSFFSITNLQASNAGVYNVAITNLAGAAAGLSSNAFLTVVTPPISQTAMAGSSATFNVSASGVAPVLYQWQFQGSDIAGATSTNLTLTNVQPSDAGNYSVVVTAVTNRPIAPATFTASLTVLTSLILSQPVLTNGSFQLLLQGIPNQSYVIEASSNLTSWSTLATIPYTNGLMPFTDTPATNRYRFYRARSGP